ncbi:MAG: DUF898 domain-containing protein, partial [Alphaproteobacteria bacterium]|nr:DUF898 domain-containing protein [Alphaproteobacteria bacterium]
MVMQLGPERRVPVVFTGSRRELVGLLVRGYVLLLPTIGLYRFWLTTWTRRFYWSGTQIDGDSLEYTGEASQLLIGFLMALAVFIPLYGLFFYLSTQSTQAAIAGYGGVALVLWFLIGYAIYRARDFRLSRTLWRGIRCDQTGNPWAYALRRFGWSLLMVATVGLAYPFMAVSLWRYRYVHSWFGTQRFGFTGSWQHLAGQYYLTYVAVVITGAIGLGIGAAMGAFPSNGQINPFGYIPVVVAGAMIGALVLRYQARELTRMFSSVRLGRAVLTVSVSGRALLHQYFRFGLALLSALILLAMGGFVVLSASAPDAFAGGSFNPQLFLQHMQGSLVTLLSIVAGYLLILAAFNLTRELFIGLAFWKL